MYFYINIQKLVNKLDSYNHEINSYNSSYNYYTQTTHVNMIVALQLSSTIEV